jgi:hypothetical protein
VLGDAADHLGTGGVHQARQLFQMFVDVSRVGRPFAWRGYQHHTLDGIADRNQ